MNHVETPIALRHMAEVRDIELTGELEPCAACGIGKVQRAKIQKEAPSIGE